MQTCSISTKFRGKQVHFLPILPRGLKITNNFIIKVNEILSNRLTADFFNINFAKLDYQPFLDPTSGDIISKLYRKDSLHLNATGGEMFRNQVQTYISKFYNSGTAPEIEPFEPEAMDPEEQLKIAAENAISMKASIDTFNDIFGDDSDPDIDEDDEILQKNPFMKQLNRKDREEARNHELLPEHLKCYNKTSFHENLEMKNKVENVFEKFMNQVRRKKELEDSEDEDESSGKKSKTEHKKLISLDDDIAIVEDSGSKGKTKAKQEPTEIIDLEKESAYFDIKKSVDEKTALEEHEKFVKEAPVKLKWKYAGNFEIQGQRNQKLHENYSEILRPKMIWERESNNKQVAWQRGEVDSLGREHKASGYMTEKEIAELKTHGMSTESYKQEMMKKSKLGKKAKKSKKDKKKKKKSKKSKKKDDSSSDGWTSG